MYGSSFADPRNWMAGPGVPYAQYQQSDPPPGPSDHLYFLGGLSSADCTIPQPTNTVDGVAFAGLHLWFGPIAVIGGGPNLPGVPLPPPPPPVAYTGTVTTAGSFTVGTLEVDCGQIKQADPATVEDEETPFAGTLTVKTTFDWTGGTLNSNTVAGTIALAPGAMGTAAPSFTNPGINGTVTLGSTLELQGTEAVFPLPSLGSSLEVNTGTYNLTLGEGFVVKQGAAINLNPIPPALQQVDAIIRIDGCGLYFGASTITVDEGATATISSFNRPRGNINIATVEIKGRSPKLINQGTVEIDDLSEIIFSPAPNRSGGYYQTTSDSENPVAPETRMEAGCAITCNGNTNVDISKGKFLITERASNGTPMADQPVIRIESSASVAFNLGQDAVFGRSGTATRPIMMQINGTGKMRADGTFEMYVDNSSADHDQFRVDGQIVFDEHAAVKAFWFTPGNPNEYWEVGSRWALFTSLSEDDDPINAAPTGFTKPPAAPSLEIQLTNDKKQVVVRRDA